MALKLDAVMGSAIWVKAADSDWAGAICRMTRGRRRPSKTDDFVLLISVPTAARMLGAGPNACVRRSRLASTAIYARVDLSPVRLALERNATYVPRGGAGRGRGLKTYQKLTAKKPPR